jgi:hypothetical protein
VGAGWGLSLRVVVVRLLLQKQRQGLRAHQPVAPPFNFSHQASHW